MHVISVAPTAGGWMVNAEVLAAPLLFHSGGKAEDAAKRLGEALAKAGRWAEIRIYMLHGALLGRFICSPPWARSAGASWRPASRTAPRPSDGSANQAA